MGASRALHPIRGTPAKPWFVRQPRVTTRRLHPAPELACAESRPSARQDPPRCLSIENRLSLSTRSTEFRTRWGAHNVRIHGTGTKRFHHAAVGELTLAYESLDLAAAPGLNMTIYSAEPGSPSDEGLRLLASLAATEDAGATARHPTA